MTGKKPKQILFSCNFLRLHNCRLSSSNNGNNEIDWQEENLLFSALHQVTFTLSIYCHTEREKLHSSIIMKLSTVYYLFCGRTVLLIGKCFRACILCPVMKLMELLDQWVHLKMQLTTTKLSTHVFSWWHLGSTI